VVDDLAMMRRAFTFIEVLVILLVVGIGLMSAVGLIVYGNQLGSKAQGETIAMATAIAVANDPSPRLEPILVSGWSYTPYDMNGLGTMTSTARGYINGVYVERTETSLPADVIARDSGGDVFVRSAHVRVVVTEAINGEELTTFSTRIIRQRGQP
jgi:Tfp pilus assembly protein PilV